VWLGFRGGKGVATGAGAFLPLAPAATGASLLVFAAALALTRYVSLASLVGAVSLSALAFALGAAPLVAWLSAAAVALIVWRHRENLARIAQGTERRLGQR
jgi:glycerol-3-phosphate acyltransferase PlsY